MHTIAQFEKHEADVGQILQTVFQTMLALEIEPGEARWSPELDLVTAVVHFAGAWKGAVLVECTPEQALDFTSRLMGIPKPAAMNDDVRDAMGEIANMVAGNLKSVLTHGVALSMPSLVEGTDYTVRMCGKSVVSRLAYSGKIGAFWVTLIEMPGDPVQ